MMESALKVRVVPVVTGPAFVILSGVLAGTAA